VPDREELLISAVSACLQAGKKILDIYQMPFDVKYKPDRSPLTLADMNAHQIISEYLKKQHPQIQLLSEEDKEIPFTERQTWTRFWLLDPLDGTKEFIKKNGEFTVNLAIIEAGRPVLGVIFIPVLKILYFAVRAEGSYKLENAAEKFKTIHNNTALLDSSRALPLENKGKELKIIASRSHPSPEVSAYIDNLINEGQAVKTITCGSSLKLCYIAEGKADIYPRLAPTMEWDIAAGHLIVTEAGGSLKDQNNEELIYNKEDLHNPWFIAKRKF